MAQVTLNIPNEQINRLVEAFGQSYQAQIPNPEYDANVENSEKVIANPETKTVFAQKELKKYLRNFVLNYERGEASRQIQEIDIT